MPLAIILTAIVLIVAGVRGSWRDLGTLLAGDFSGSQSFLNWLAAIGLVGCLGYVPQLQKFSRAFLALIIIAMFLKQGTGVFDQLVSALKNPLPDAPHPNPGNPNPQGGSGFLSRALQGMGVPSFIANSLN